MKSHIPNLFTASNLLCGMLALIFVFTDDIIGATVAIGLALLMDFLDGFVARALGVSSPIGKELDSLADNITFGAVPGFVMARLIQESLGAEFIPTDWFDGTGGPWFLIGFLISVYSAIRLARFNLDERQSDAFYGVPTPANTALILSFWLILEFKPDSFLAAGLGFSWVLIGLTLLSSWLLIADIRLIALKFKTYDFASNKYRYLLVISSLILLVLLQYVAIPFIFLIYFLLSFLQERGLESVH
ncbi:MAG: CDP-alcohol phosphatidyltransferase family protein [Bacteroidota bacterium]